MSDHRTLENFGGLYCEQLDKSKFGSFKVALSKMSMQDFCEIKITFEITITYRVPLWQGLHSLQFPWFTGRKLLAHYPRFVNMIKRVTINKFPQHTFGYIVRILHKFAIQISINALLISSSMSSAANVNIVYVEYALFVKSRLPHILLPFWHTVPQFPIYIPVLHNTYTCK